MRKRLRLLANTTLAILLSGSFHLSGQNIPGTFQNEATTKYPNQPKGPASGGLTSIYSSTGKYTLSVDGVGSSDLSMNIQVNKPTASATVKKAILISTGTNTTIADGCVTLAGSSVSWNGYASTPYVFNNYWADVTAVVAAQINGLAAGVHNISVTECSTSGIEGEGLLVIFDDAAATEKTVIVMWGAMNSAGDNFSVTLGTPIDPALPGALLDMGLGIGYSFQYGGGLQSSTVSVNGTLISSSAGGEDDGTSGNGALITIGGMGDDHANPSDPTAGTSYPGTDDELYNILPFITNTTSNVTITTLNATGDDNIFLAYFAMSGAAIIGEGILLSQTSSTGTTGTNHTAKAVALNSLGVPISARAVTFNITAGPNAGNTYTANTDVNGEVLYTYTGSGGSGTDNIQAHFTSSLSEVLYSNTLSFEWTEPACANPSDGGTIASAQTICSGFVPAAITSSALPSGHTGTLEYKWQLSSTGNSSGFDDIASANSAAYTPGALTTTTWYKRLARVTCMPDWTDATASNVLEITVNQASFTPAGKTLGDLQVTGSGIQWYDAASGGNPVATSTAINAVETTYYASQTINNCESAERLAVLAYMDPTPCSPTGSAAQDFCTEPTVADLTATGSNIRWYTAAAGGTALLPTTVLTDGTYYASQTIDCTESASRLAVAVGATPLATPEIGGPASGHPNTPGYYYSILSVANSTYVWAVTGGTILSGQGETMIRVKWNTTGTQTITVTITRGACEVTGTKYVSVTDI